AGDADDRAAPSAEGLVRIAVRVRRGLVERQALREEEVRDRRGAALVGRNVAGVVRDRQRRPDVARHGRTVLEGGARGRDLAALRGARETVRVALDDRRLRREREAE